MPNTTTKHEIELMKLKMESMEEKLDAMDDKLTDLVHQLLHPDDGYVSRVNKNTQFREDTKHLIGDIYELKRWKETISKVLWIATSGIIIGLVKLLFFM